MDMSKDIEQLQTTIAFQEHTIAQLNEALISQQKQLDAFKAELALLNAKLTDVEARQDSQGQQDQQEKPPHY